MEAVVVQEIEQPVAGLAQGTTELRESPDVVVTRTDVSEELPHAPDIAATEPGDLAIGQASLRHFAFNRMPQLSVADIGRTSAGHRPTFLLMYQYLPGLGKSPLLRYHSNAEENHYQPGSDHCQAKEVRHWTFLRWGKTAGENRKRQDFLVDRSPPACRLVRAVRGEKAFLLPIRPVLGRPVRAPKNRTGAGSIEKQNWSFWGSVAMTGLPRATAWGAHQHISRACSSGRQDSSSALDVRSGEPIEQTAVPSVCQTQHNVTHNANSVAHRYGTTDKGGPDYDRTHE